MIGVAISCEWGWARGGASVAALVLEDQDVAQALVASQVEQAGAVGDQHQEELVHVEIGGLPPVVRVFHDDLVAPTPLRRSNSPSASRVTSPSTRKTGNLLGTTRTCQLGPEPPGCARGMTRISWGVRCS